MAGQQPRRHAEILSGSDDLQGAPKTGAPFFAGKHINFVINSR